MGASSRQNSRPHTSLSAPSPPRYGGRAERVRGYAGSVPWSRPGSVPRAALPSFTCSPLDRTTTAEPDALAVPGAGTAMKCLVCGAVMRLMRVEQRGDPTLEVAFERHTFKCSACPQISQRLVFSRPRSPLTDLSVTPPSKFPQSTDLQVARLAGATALAKVAENLRNRRRRVSIQARAVAPEGFEKHERQDAPVQERRGRSEGRRTSTWAEAVEKVRTRQIALQNRAVALSPLHPILMLEKAKN